MDVILVNGKMTTMAEKEPQVEALALRGDTIAALGSNPEVLALKGAKTEVIDLKGKRVVPGFNDSHMHLVNYGLSLSSVDLRECRSLSQVGEKLGGHIRSRNLRQSWVFGWGWNQESFAEKRMPVRQDLDPVSGDNFVVIMRTCNHVCSVNTEALKKAGIFESPPAVAGGEVHLDPQGRPSGILKENAMKLVLGITPRRDKGMLKKLILQAARECLQFGLTSLQTDDFGVVRENFREVLEAYLELDAEGQLPLRVNKQLLLPNKAQLEAFLDLGYRTGDGSPFFKIGPLKLLADGSLGARTAALHAPYADDPENRGMSLYSREELEELVAAADRGGLQVAVHAIGDRAMEMCLDAGTLARHRQDPRFRVIHCSIASRENLKKFQDLGAIADVQPSFVASDHAYIEERVGKERARYAYCFKTFLRSGIRLAGGSDCPIESCNPLLGIHAAVTRTNPSGKPPGGWMPREKLTLQEALHMYTAGSAYCTYEEKLKGSLALGKWGDLVILSEDVSRVKPGEIKDVEVLMTMVGGKILYNAL